MYEVKTLEGKLVADENMKVAIVASRFNEIIVNKLFGSIEKIRRCDLCRCSYPRFDFSL